jgi:hypothetical protein
MAFAPRFTHAKYGMTASGTGFNSVRSADDTCRYDDLCSAAAELRLHHFVDGSVIGVFPS